MTDLEYWNSNVLEIWKQADKTGGGSRYHRTLGCWLFSSEKDIPDYLQKEFAHGRVMINSLFTNSTSKPIETQPIKWHNKLFYALIKLVKGGK